MKVIYPNSQWLVKTFMHSIVIMEPQDPISASRCLLHTFRDASRYFFLFAMQTTGAAILFLVCRSPFQASSSRPGRSCTANGEFGLVVVGNHVDAGGVLGTPSTSSGLPQVRNALVGHIVLFVARMSFVLATSVFGFVLIVRRPELFVPTSRYFVLTIGLFALFCYTQELKQLGRALIGPDRGKTG